MDNTIYQYAIGELLDGRYFYIPSYQRGYRWTEKQVGDLLRDLLCFANDYADEGKDKKQDQFYCLQPIIARPITDESKLKSIFGSHHIKDYRWPTAFNYHLSAIQVSVRPERLGCSDSQRRRGWQRTLSYQLCHS